MKLFGKKDGGNDADLPEGAPGDEAAFEETGEALSAPTRPEIKPSGGRKSLLVLLLLLVAGGLGGGYFFLTQEEDYVAPVAQNTPAPEAAPAPAPDMTAALPPAISETPQGAIVPPAPPGDPLAVPPMPADSLAAASTDPLATTDPLAPPAPAADPLDAQMASTGEGLAAVPPMPGAETGAIPADPASVDQPADPLANIEDPLGPPPDAAAADTIDQPATDIAAPTAAGGETVPVAPTPEMAAAETVPPAPLDTSEDLPLPPSEESMTVPPVPAAPATPAETAVALATPEAATPATPAGTAATLPGSEAETAIVNNAGKLDAMPAPQGATAMDAIAAEQAMIRPLPKQYLVVQKDHSAGEIDTRLTSARLALTQGRAQAALQIFNELQESFPRDKRVLMGRAVALQKLGQNGEALAAYEDVLNRDPKNIEALTNMLGLLKAENPSLAVEKLLELREAYPYNADITAQLGIAYAGSGEYEEAQKYLEMADALKPGSAFVLYNRGVLYDKMGRTSEAADIYRQIVRMAADGYLDQNLPIDTIKRRLAVMR